MKNSSIGSLVFVRVDSSSAIVLFSTTGPLDGLCPAARVLSQPFSSVQLAELHVLEEP